MQTKWERSNGSGLREKKEKRKKEKKRCVMSVDKWKKEEKRKNWRKDKRVEVGVKK